MIAWLRRFTGPGARGPLLLLILVLRASPTVGRGETSISPAPLVLEVAPFSPAVSRLETSNPEESEEETAWLPVLHQDTPSLHPPEPSTKPTVPSTPSWLEVEPPRFETIKTINPTDNYSDLKYTTTTTTTTIIPQKELTILPTEPSNSQYSWNLFYEKPLHFSSADIIEPGDKVSNSWLEQNVPTINEEGVSFPSDRDTKATSGPSYPDDLSFSSPPPATDTQGKFSAHLAQAAIHEATAFGLDQMRFLVNVTEPTLYQMGLTLRPGSAGGLLAAFNWQPGTEALVQYAHAALQTTTHLQASPHLLRLPGGRPAVPDNALLRQCPLRQDGECPGDWQHFRTADGRCNNPQHPAWGAALTPYRRLLPADYHDGVQEVRRSVTGERLPSARLLSTAVLRDPVGGSEDPEDFPPEESHASHLLMQWGQFVDHDLTATPQSFGFNGSTPQCCANDGSGSLAPHLRHPECLAIKVQRSDPHFGVLGVRCLQFVRSAPSPTPTCALGARQQANAVTGFLDGSALYASSQQRQFELRLFHKGLLNSLPGTRSKPMLPPASPDEQGLCRFSAQHPCLRSGDFRVNEQPGLTSVHTLWLREHNRVAAKLRSLNPRWGDERLFQETRRIVVATLQHVTLTEFLPQVLGPDVMTVFELDTPHPGYDEDSDPTVPNAFAAAAFRFGHTLVQDSLWRCNAKHQQLPSNLSLHEELAVAGAVLGVTATERLLIGLSRQLSRNSDHRISRELTDHLFESPESGPGLDLAAINIQRGRDHGLPAYNKWRRPCGLRTLEKWEDLPNVAIPRFAAVLPHLYNHVDDIDLYVGGVAERPVPGGLVGPTFACIIGQTFADLRMGDRFWYEVQDEPSSFSPEQLEQLRRSSLARLMCDNLEGVRTVARWPLQASPSTPNNEYKKCTDLKNIPQVNLAAWQDPADGARFTTPPSFEVTRPAILPNSVATNRPRPGQNGNTNRKGTTRRPPNRGGGNKRKPAGTSNAFNQRPSVVPNRVIAIATQLNSNRPADGMANLGALFQSKPNRPVVQPNRVVTVAASAPQSQKPSKPVVTPNRVIAIATQVNNRPAVMSNLMGGSKPPRITLMARPAPPVKVVQRQRVTSNEKMKLEWPISEIPHPIKRHSA